MLCVGLLDPSQPFRCPRPGRASAVEIANTLAFDSGLTALIAGTVLGLTAWAYDPATRRY